MAPLTKKGITQIPNTTKEQQFYDGIAFETGLQLRVCRYPAKHMLLANTLLQPFDIARHLVIRIWYLTYPLTWHAIDASPPGVHDVDPPERPQEPQKNVNVRPKTSKQEAKPKCQSQIYVHRSD